MILCGICILYFGNNYTICDICVSPRFIFDYDICDICITAYNIILLYINVILIYTPSDRKYSFRSQKDVILSLFLCSTKKSTPFLEGWFGQNSILLIDMSNSKMTSFAERRKYKAFQKFSQELRNECICFNKTIIIHSKLCKSMIYVFVLVYLLILLGLSSPCFARAILFFVWVLVWLVYTFVCEDLFIFSMCFNLFILCIDFICELCRHSCIIMCGTLSLISFLDCLCVFILNVSSSNFKFIMAVRNTFLINIVVSGEAKSIFSDKKKLILWFWDYVFYFICITKTSYLHLFK